MSSKHLAKGSERPLKVKDKLRLYSMEFCPYALRVRLVLKAKGISHDIVNVHLKNKPDWLFELHPEGKVPALDIESKVLIESLVISDYLDEKYPDPPLYPNNKSQVEEDKTIIQGFEELTTIVLRALHSQHGRPFHEILAPMLPHVGKLEEHLRQRGYAYFGGGQPNMVDYMLWPWVDFVSGFALYKNSKLPGESEYPYLYAWCRAMRSTKPVMETAISRERFCKLFEQFFSETGTIDYDSI